MFDRIVMTDDPKTLADEYDRLSNRLRRLEAPPAAHWIDAFTAGDVIGTEVAARVLGASPATAKRRAVASAARKHPIAICIGGTWWFSVSRLLDDIEREDGL